jgi:superfamily II DNA or RNA helicase
MLDGRTKIEDMALTEKLSRHVSRKVQERGREYFRAGAVSVDAGGPDFVEARVRGSENYHCTVELNGRSLVGWCSCPYIDQFFTPCKHLWAVLLAAERGGFLTRADKVPMVKLVLDEGLLSGGADGDDWQARYDEREEAEPASPAPAPAQPRHHHHPQPHHHHKHQPQAPAHPPQPQQHQQQRPKGARRRRGRGTGYKPKIGQVRTRLETEGRRHGQRFPTGRRLLYIVDLAASQQQRKLVIEVAQQHRKKDGDWTRPKAEHLTRERAADMPDPADRQILLLLFGAERNAANGTPAAAPGPGVGEVNGGVSRFALAGAAAENLLARMSRTDRLRLRSTVNPPDLRELRCDSGPPWMFWLQVRLDEAKNQYNLTGVLRRRQAERPIAEPLWLTQGLVMWNNRIARLDDGGAFAWVDLLRQDGGLRVPGSAKDDLLRDLLELPGLPHLDLPPELHYDEYAPPARPRLTVRTPKVQSTARAWLEAHLSFDYDGTVISVFDRRRAIYQPDRRRLMRRNLAFEQECAAKLEPLLIKPREAPGESPCFELLPQNLPRAVRTLTEAGWHVEAEGKVYRQAGSVTLEVRSGLDWFDLHGGIDFGGHTASIPRLLQAIKRGDGTITLDDGTVGIVPDEWLKKYGVLAGLGASDGDHIRFGRAQVGLLDALLFAQPEAEVDQVFRQARDQLRTFEGVEAADPPAGFIGQLRGYQREGLGWLDFLARFGFGGCLADDMGLGKTVQVLALLAGRRAAHPKKDPGPSLVVLPRSLVFNWKAEAARFVPSLRILDHTGVSRGKSTKHFADFDLVLTTYGTLRRDALLFKDVTFDYVILDEAQTIKNSQTAGAKAARLLRSRHRLALSGTPVENHLGELWSLFEFLNPGMLGHASLFRMSGGAARNPDPDTRDLLARGLRPFILRRTKEQVAKDLPAKTEQTLFCDLEPEQRKLYDELRDHYRRSLLSHVDEVGIKRSKIQVLEALLRLRQAACHPGLVDKERTSEASAKMDVLHSQLEEVVDEGHKAIVFSQFTSLLAILRAQLDAEGVTYEYLDGRTRDRQARVERFQNDPECMIFLVSLKAGGLGLNLTAAEYVFLLDPWWNPAVESQAIDRAHRIGQTRPVFAYRLIARDTVEEKVLELQKTKRDLADAILGGDNNLITDLQREDLELLLS